MKKTLLTVLALALLALPAAAQNSPDFKAGLDAWKTVDGTHITLNGADWRALCGVTNGAKMEIKLAGGNLAGFSEADTVIRRLDDTVFVNGKANVRIQTRGLTFISNGFLKTPCGELGFTVGLQPNAQQPIGSMTIYQDANGEGGSFVADVLIDGQISAHKRSGATVGTLPFSARLVDQAGSTPWSANPPAGSGATGRAFYPGVDPVQARAVINIRSHEEIEAAHWYALAVADLHVSPSQY